MGLGKGSSPAEVQTRTARPQEQTKHMRRAGRTNLLGVYAAVVENEQDFDLFTRRCQRTH